MTPEQLQRLNLEHFERVLERTSDPDVRAQILRLMEEERGKTCRDSPDPDKLTPRRAPT